MNFMYALLKAVVNDQNTLSWQQVTDANSTNINTWIEHSIYTSTSSILSKDAQSLKDFINNNKSKLKDQSVMDHITVLNTQYQKDSTNAQSVQNQADTLVQGSQTQAGQDGQNLSTKAQLAQTMTSILSTLASVLMQRY